ncbi:hypothetical protein Psuf_061200 [Phytohabitans suffuscus]|uniref:Uncharacterized protein n=1 Tax=Phytohabitans suffuscus TaxID=624315 RepID=A0A6F8YRM9_9ACTN|nr:hypothetical protein Psuf_061200 [Phytohabitans suffuscus]
MQRRRGAEGLDGGLEDDRGVFAAAGRELAYAGLAGERRDTGPVGGGDRGRQHRLRLLGVDQVDDRRPELVQRFALDREQQPGVRAELARARGQRRHVAGGHLAGGLGEPVGEQEDGVDAGHLRIYRDGHRAGLGDRQQRQPAGPRAGEAHRGDPGVGDEPLAGLVSLPDHQREHPLWHTRLGGRREDAVGGERGGVRVRGVALDDDRAAGGQCGGGVATGGGEGEREVRGAEDRDRAEGDAPGAQVGTGQRLPVGLGGQVFRRGPGRVAEQVGEHAQLPGGAGELAAGAGLGEGGLLADGGDEWLGRGFQPRGDRAQEGGAVGVRRVAVRVERGSRAAARLRDVKHCQASPGAVSWWRLSGRR